MDYPKPNKSVSLNGIRFDSTIPPGARILFAEFCEWAKDNNGEVPYETKKFAELYHVSTFTIRKWIKVLAEHKLVNIHIDWTGGSQQKFIYVNKG